MIARELVGFLVLAAGCSSPDTVPRWEPTACRFALPAGQIEGQTVSCGDLVVAENRERAASATVKLHVLKFPSELAPDGAPTLFLAGGPGKYVGPEIQAATPAEIAALTATGDYLIMDYRGVEESMPALDCPAFARAPDANQRVQALLACYADYAARGIDIAMYDSHAVADDIDDLRQALGYGQLNLVGVSYGTRFALEVMRRHPEGVRAVVLDSPVPPATLWWAEAGRHLEASYRGLFALCAADPACDAKYPALESQLVQAINDLTATPLIVSVNGFQVPIAGDTLIAALNLALYARAYYPRIPLVVDAARRRDAPILGQVATEMAGVATGASYGMNQAVWCNDSVQYSSASDVAQAQEGVGAEIRAYFADQQIAVAQDGCASMAHKTPDPLDREAVTSSIPTLILVGEFDPVTPPGYGETAAAGLSQATLIQLPKSGHASRNTECGFVLSGAFLAAPETTPDTSCLADLEALTFL